MQETLIKRDSKGKIRVVKINCELSDLNKTWVINKSTGLYKGTFIKQPSIEISLGKANRTLLEQVELVFNSSVKSYLDQGYKSILSFGYNSIDDFNPESVLPKINTDQNGFKKHMLAKAVTDKLIKYIDTKDYWYCSRKVDGVRNSFYFKDNKIHTASRGGGDYDNSLKDFINNEVFIEFFKKHPDYQLDGEIYKHGKSLQCISGAVRSDKKPDFDLEYYIYDIMIDNKTFEERLVILNDIQKELNLSFDPNRIWEDEDLRIQMLPHIKVYSYKEAKEEHDKYVSNGWEGCVLRDPNCFYQYGGRGNQMIKIKEFQDAEYEIVGLSDGLREEDLCFILKTEDGQEFKAKPIGSKDLKLQYKNNINNIVGKMGTIKYFYLSDTGIPLLPVFKCVRDYD